MKKVQNIISTLLCGLINRLVHKNDRSILFIPHINCINDHYDIINYKSDNVLCLFNSLLHDPDFASYSLSIVYYHKDKLIDYQNYLGERDNVTFIYYSDAWKKKCAFFKSKTIFTDNYYEYFLYRTSSQRIVCLAYYAGPIKDAFWKIKLLGGYRRFLKIQRRVNYSYDSYVSVSDMMSKFIAIDNLIYYPKFISLGFPRNDVFYQDNSCFRRALLESIGVSAKYIISYTPTHRDYENKERIFFDKTKLVHRSIWGVVEIQDLESLDRELEAINAIVIAKAHPSQEKDIIASYESKRVFLYSAIEKKIQINLQELLATSDLLVTDYTSAVYDFLHADKPIINYLYDIDKYNNTRGFFINPIEPFLCGEIAYDMKGLIECLHSIVYAGKYDYTKQKILKDILIRDKDGDSTNRVKQYFFGEREK